MFTTEWELKWKTLPHANNQQVTMLSVLYQSQSRSLPKLLYKYYRETLFSFFPNLFKQWHVDPRLNSNDIINAVHLAQFFGVNLPTRLTKSFTFNTHLENPQNIDINQDFLIVGPVWRDVAVGWKSFHNCGAKKGTFQESLIVRVMTMHLLNL